MSLATTIDMGPATAACADPLPDSPLTHVRVREAPGVPGPAAAATTAALFVATDLQCWETGEPEIYARDVEVDGIVYRKLDPAYYSWLWSRVQRVIAAYDAHRIERLTFDGVIDRWAPVHKRARDTWGVDGLRSAERAASPRTYSPPRAATEKSASHFSPASFPDC